MDDDASSANSVKNFWHHLKKLGSDNSDHVTEEIISMVNEGHEQGVFQATEAEMITNIFEFGDKEAKDIMTNRKNILAIEQDTRLEDAITQMLDAGKSRFPVYHENIDEIVGILHFRDAIVADRKEENAGKCVGSIEGLLREAMVIPETKNIADLFRMMQKTKTQMVIVVDEYGQTKGVLAMEDILEEIVGEINDEYDEKEETYTKLSNNTYIFEACTLLNDFIKIVDADPDSFKDIEGEADTLAGLILEIKGELPGKNDVITYQSHKFTILEVDNRRIKKIKYEKN